MAWQRASAGDESKGKRWYQRALVEIAGPGDGHRWLLIRRHPAARELAYFRCYSPRPVPLQALVAAASLRWTVEESFQASMGLCGLDEHHVHTVRREAPVVLNGGERPSSPGCRGSPVKLRAA